MIVGSKKQQVGKFLSILVLMGAGLTGLNTVSGAELLNRSITMNSVTPSTTASHQFQFDIQSSATLGSIAFQYCEAPLVTDPCIAPSGIDVSSATMAGQSGETGFSIHPNTVSNRIVISRAALASSPGMVAYSFDSILNPDTANHTTYVRISTYTATDGTGGVEDNGAVAFSLTPALGVNVYVPPYLVFCVGVTVSLQCQSANGLSINLGTLSASQTSVATTQFAGATNDSTGYSVSAIGTTMTSGNNEITRLSNSTGSIVGTRQFGLNLRANSNPATGNEPDGIGTALPTPPYNSPNAFKFTSGEVISSSPTATDYNRMTVTYIVNIAPDQAPGIYSTTLTYVAVASF
ncbi:MAG TPA: hypothetical protein VD947_04585 [Patescibacteria group bacterium]|nr:hypothetical protein [Patescibacteria group bacterium]